MPATTRSHRARTLHGLLAALALGLPVSAIASASPAQAANPVVLEDSPGPIVGQTPIFEVKPPPPPPEPSWVLPVEGYEITGTFGSSGSMWSSTHTGLDFAAGEGTPIDAVSGGTVQSVEYDGAYGNKTVVELDDGTEVWYCHQSATSVEPGQEVEAGDEIGSVGSTGNTTGPHLHLEFQVAGEPQDPVSVLSEHGLEP